MSSTLVVFLMTLTAVMTLPVFDPATPKVSTLSIGMRTIESAIELVTEAAKQTAEFQPAANLKAGLMLTNHEAAFGRNTATKCTLANGAGVRLEFIEIGSKGLLPSYKPPQFLEPGEVASFLVEKNIPFELKYNIQTFQGPGGWMGGDDTTAVTLSSTTVPAQINTDVQVGRGTTKYPTQISFDLSRDGDFYHFVATQSIGPDVPLPTIPGLIKCADAPSGIEPCWELADGTMEDIPQNFLKDNTDLTGTLKLGAAVKTIGHGAFFQTKLEGLDLSQAESLVSIGVYAFLKTDITGTLVIPAKVKTIADKAFYQAKLTGLDLSQAASLESIGEVAFANTDITGTLVIPAKVKTIGHGAFYEAKLTGLDLSKAASLESIGPYAFLNTDITGMIVTPFTVPAYNAAISFPPGVTIVKG